MAFVRIVNLTYWDHDKQQFNHLAFSGYKRLSIIDADCAVESSGGVCQHIGRFYRKPAGDPACFWPVPDGTFPARCVPERRPTAEGDDCHYELPGMTRGEADAIRKRLHYADCYVCVEDGGHRTALASDLPPPLPSP